MGASLSLLIATMVRDPFMPTNVLDGSTDTECDVKLRRHRLTRTSDLPFQWQPAAVADWARSRHLAPEHFGQLFRNDEIFSAP